MHLLSSFGSAVHGVLPVLAQGYDPLQFNRAEVWAALQTLPNIKHEHHGTDLRFLNLVHQAWHSIGDYALGADHFMTEPDFLGTRQIDLVLQRTHTLELVEIKTRSDYTFGEESREKAVSQLREAAQTLRTHLPDVPVRATIYWILARGNKLRIKLQDVTNEL